MVDRHDYDDPRGTMQLRRLRIRRCYRSGEHPISASAIPPYGSVVVTVIAFTRTRHTFGLDSARGSFSRHLRYPLINVP